MKAIYIDTLTIGQQFLPAIFNGDLSDLSAAEETAIEREHHDYLSHAEEEYGEDCVSIEYECTSSERYICRCDLTRLLSECVEVKVYAMVKDGEPTRRRGIMNMDGTIEYFDGEY